MWGVNLFDPEPFTTPAPEAAPAPTERRAPAPNMDRARPFLSPFTQLRLPTMRYPGPAAPGMRVNPRQFGNVMRPQTGIEGTRSFNNRQELASIRYEHFGV